MIRLYEYIEWATIPQQCDSIFRVVDIVGDYDDSIEVICVLDGIQQEEEWTVVIWCVLVHAHMPTSWGKFDKAVKIELYCQNITSFIISLTLLVMCALYVWNLKDALYHIMMFSIT